MIALLAEIDANSVILGGSGGGIVAVLLMIVRAIVQSRDYLRDYLREQEIHQVEEIRMLRKISSALGAEDTSPIIVRPPPPSA